MASERGVFGWFVEVGTVAVAGAAVAGATAVETFSAGAGSVGGKGVASGCAASRQRLHLCAGPAVQTAFRIFKVGAQHSAD